MTSHPSVGMSKADSTSVMPWAMRYLCFLLRASSSTHAENCSRTLQNKVPMNSQLGWEYVHLWLGSSLFGVPGSPHGWLKLSHIECPPDGASASAVWCSVACLEDTHIENIAETAKAAGEEKHSACSRPRETSGLADARLWRREGIFRYDDAFLLRDASNLFKEDMVTKGNF